MKVDFRAQFKDISRLLDAQHKHAPGSTKESAFETLLGSLSPQKREYSEGVTAGPKSASSSPIGAQENAPLARFRPSPPEPRLPIPDAKLAPEFPVPSVKESASDVKTPTLISVRRLTETPSPELLPKPEISKAPGKDDVHELIKTAGLRHGIDPLLGMAVVEAESSFNPNAVSSDGHESKGLFQLLDGTGKHLLEKAGLEKRYDPFNPQLNVDLGVSYLRHLHDVFSRPSALSNGITTSAAANSASLEKLAVAAFNAGEGRVASAQQRAAKDGKDPADYAAVESYLPGSTREYVSRVITLRDRMSDTAIG